MTKEEKKVIVAKFGENEKDTGSASVQVALLTKRINDLNAHIKANHTDATASRALMALVGKRKRLLTYLAENDNEAYLKLIAALGLRK